MSLTINRTGGSGGVSENNAILMAHAPTGSTVTASKGGVILTPKMWVSDSTANEDVAMFIFSPAQFDSVNPWTITATDGEKTKSKAILIETNVEYEIMLLYRYEIFADGKIVNAPTLYSANNIDLGALTEESEGDLDFVRWYRRFSTYTIAAAYVELDVTNYSRIAIDLLGWSNYRYNTQPTTPAICLADSPFSGETNGAWNNVNVYALFQPTTGRYTSATPSTFSVDISSYVGTKCVFVSMGGTTNEDTYQNIRNFYVEQ